MKKQLDLWITLGLLAIVLVACSLTGSKADVIKCTGTSKAISESQGEVSYVKSVKHYHDTVIKYDYQSSCTELTGVLTVNVDYTDTDKSMWGTFYFVTAYEGGGAFEGTFHAANNYLDSEAEFTAEATSYSATGSLKGLQMVMNVTGQSSSPELPFEATIQKLPDE